MRRLAVLPLLVACFGCSSDQPDRESACRHAARWARSIGDETRGAEALRRARADAEDAADSDEGLKMFAQALARADVDGWGSADDQGIVVETCQDVWADDLGGTGDA